MAYRIVRVLLAVLALHPVGLAAAERAQLKPEIYYSQIARRFASQFPQEHLTQAPLDDAVSLRAWSNYVTSLDYDRSYFLESDLKAFRTEEFDLDNELKSGDLVFPYRVYETYRQRLSNRYDYVCSLLQKSFNLDEKETYKWKRKDASWPKDDAEWNELWRKKIKNEYVQRVVSLKLAEEAAKVEKNGKPEAKNGDSALLTPEEFIKRRYKQLLTVTEDNDAVWVFQRYLMSFCQAYDPHSAYMSAESTEDFDIEMRLSLVGIGALLTTSEDGAAKVVRLIPGGPADQDKSDVKLAPGDKIIAVAEGDNAPVDILHLPLQQTVKKIRGKKGTKVVLTVIPAADPTGSTTKKVPLVRDEVKLEEQAASWKRQQVAGDNGVTQNVGVITLPTFYSNIRAGTTKDDVDVSSSRDVENLLKNMKGTNSVDGVLLDLRNNGGGSLLEAIKMSGLFIGSGNVVQVKDRRSIRALPDPDPAVVYGGPLVVLVNRLSASASEILAGALQDYGRAVLVGDSKTHGKGSVQTVLSISRDPKFGTVKITNASYYRVTGVSTQLKGISPDIVIPSPLDYVDLGEEFLPNAMALTNESPAKYSPVADLKAMIAVLNEKSVKRRADDPRFKTYAILLERINAVSKTEEVPLDLENRMKLARDEKEVASIENEDTADEDTPGGKKDGKPDLVLIESLRILADVANLRRTEPPSPISQPGPRDSGSFLDAIMEWFRSP